jgi:hypothetical protein
LLNSDTIYIGAGSTSDPVGDNQAEAQQQGEAVVTPASATHPSPDGDFIDRVAGLLLDTFDIRGFFAPGNAYHMFACGLQGT